MVACLNLPHPNCAVINQMVQNHLLKAQWELCVRHFLFRRSCEIVRWVRWLMLRRGDQIQDSWGCGATLELARPAENPQIFRVGGRVGERIACKNNCTREGWGRCPKGASSSGVSLLRPVERASFVFLAVLSPTATMHSLPSLLSWCPPCEGKKTNKQTKTFLSVYRTAKTTTS